MTYELAVALSFSILIPALFGLLKVFRINRAWLPFIIIMWLGLVTEFIAWQRMYRPNGIYNNVYVLLEAGFFTWQFYNWGIYKKKRWLFAGLLISYLVFWIIECIIFKKIDSGTTYFRIYYSFLIVLMSINCYSILLNSSRTEVFLDPIFIICTAFIIYFTLKTITVSFGIYGTEASYAFRQKIAFIMPYINAFCNVIYGVAILCMKRKYRSLEQY